MIPNVQNGPTIQASEITAPPAWALLERQLFDLMERGADLVVEKYCERGGVPYYADDMDDLFEIAFGWGLFYSMGARSKVLDLALQHWNAVNRWGDSSIVSRVKHGTWPRGGHREPFRQQITNEYWNNELPHGAEWHHMGEANMTFYEFGLADPTISENVRRARRFAGLFLGEDPDASNYDPVHKIIRSPIHGSSGPYLRADLYEAGWWLYGGLGERAHSYPRRVSLHPTIKDLERDWDKDPDRALEVVRVFDDMVLNGDIANNLAATGLVTNAYLYTGESKYKEWVLEYVEAWIDRIQTNDGIIPDNVGPTGQPGEQRGGQWWGGLYGWATRGFNNIAHSITIGAQCAVLLSGDYSYLELLRSQIKVVLDQAKSRDDGQLLVPLKHGVDGWDGYMPVRVKELAHLYHASMTSEDRDLMLMAREGDVDRNWNEVVTEGQKNAGNAECARFQYYEGLKPGWPEEALSAELQQVAEILEVTSNERRTVEQLIVENIHPPLPVVTKTLNQIMLGAPQPVYNGGLNQGMVRYFSPPSPSSSGEAKEVGARPGLPDDVAALVDQLGPKVVGVHLVNTGHEQTRRVVVQAGMYGEHQFTHAKIKDQTIPVEGKYVSVELPPSTSVRISFGVDRHVNDPSYAFPWHDQKIPVPFQ